MVAAHRLTRGQRAGCNYFPLFLIAIDRSVVDVRPAASLTVSVTVTVLVALSRVFVRGDWRCAAYTRRSIAPAPVCSS